MKNLKKLIPGSHPEKLTEKAFYQSITIAIISMILCIAALCSTTWAWFREDISTQNAMLVSGRFDLSCTVKDPAAAELTVTQNEKGVLSCTLPGTGAHTVSLSMTNDTTASKGYCIVTVNNTLYLTAPIVANSTNPFVFTLQANEPSLTVTFEAIWGSPARTDIQIDTTLTVGTAQTTAVDPAQTTPVDSEQTTPVDPEQTTIVE